MQFLVMLKQMVHSNNNYFRGITEIYEILSRFLDNWRPLLGLNIIRLVLIDADICGRMSSQWL
jgi:hypothetical protein